MPKLIAVTRVGDDSRSEGEAALSVMDAIRVNGFDELLALRVGRRLFATCPVHLKPASAGRLLPMSEDEDGTLDCTDHGDATSRPSCQLPFSDALVGLKVTSADED